MVGVLVRQENIFRCVASMLQLFSLARSKLLAQQSGNMLVTKSQPFT